MQSIDRNLAFDYGFALALRTGAVRGQRAEDQAIQEKVLESSIAQVTDLFGLSEDEAISALQQRYDALCVRSERHPMVKIEGEWVYRGHCTACGSFTGLSTAPLEIGHLCPDCS